MLCLLLTTWLLTDPPALRLGPFEQPPIGYATPKVTETGGYALASMDRFTRFDKNGQKKFTLDLPSTHWFLTFQDHGDYFFLGTINYTNWNGELRVVDRDGNQVATCGIGVLQLHKTENQLYFWYFKNGGGAYGGAFPYQYAKFHYDATASSFHCWDPSDQLDQRFGKISPMQKAMRYNYRTSWLADDSERMLSMNEVEPRIYLHPKPDPDQETKVDETTAPTTPSKLLNLPGAVLIEGFPTFDRVLYKPAENDRMWWNWRQHHSFMLGFFRLDDGFVVAYHRPTCPRQPGPEGVCDPARLALQRLDSDLNLTGAPLLTDGFPLGIHPNGQLAVLQPVNYRRYRSLNGPPPYFADVVFINLE